MELAWGVREYVPSRDFQGCVWCKWITRIGLVDEKGGMEERAQTKQKRTVQFIRVLKPFVLCKANPHFSHRRRHRRRILGQRPLCLSPAKTNSALLPNSAWPTMKKPFLNTVLGIQNIVISPCSAFKERLSLLLLTGSRFFTRSRTLLLSFQYQTAFQSCHFVLGRRCSRSGKAI